MTPPLLLLARALYLPALLWALVGFWMVFNGQPAYGGVSGIMGGMFALLGFCAAVKASGMIKPVA
jgi:hypothetical protein